MKEINTQKALFAAAVSMMGIAQTAKACLFPVIDHQRIGLVDESERKMVDIHELWIQINEIIKRQGKAIGKWEDVQKARKALYPGPDLDVDGECGPAGVDPTIWIYNSPLLAEGEGNAQGKEAQDRRALGIVAQGYHPWILEEADPPQPSEAFAQQRIPPAVRTATNFVNEHEQRTAEIVDPASTRKKEELGELGEDIKRIEEDLKKAIEAKILIEGSDEVKEARTWIASMKGDEKKANTAYEQLAGRARAVQSTTRRAEAAGAGKIEPELVLGEMMRAVLSCKESASVADSTKRTRNIMEMQWAIQTGIEKGFTGGLVTFTPSEEEDKKEPVEYENKEKYEEGLSEYLKKQSASDMSAAVHCMPAEIKSDDYEMTDVGALSTRNKKSMLDIIISKEQGQEGNRHAVMRETRKHFTIVTGLSAQALARTLIDGAAQTSVLGDRIGEALEECRTLICEVRLLAQAKRLAAQQAQDGLEASLAQLWLEISYLADNVPSGREE